MIKMNKKGFTLIEMLVVIAIIAILVAIIIPTVMSATEKAAAATNAANLRSVKSEATTNYLLTKKVDPYTHVVAKEVSSLKVTKDSALHVEWNETKQEVDVDFGGKTIDDFVEVAGGVRSGTADSNNNNNNNNNNDNNNNNQPTGCTCTDGGRDCYPAGTTIFGDYPKGGCGHTHKEGERCGQ